MQLNQKRHEEHPLPYFVTGTPISVRFFYPGTAGSASDSSVTSRTLFQRINVK